MDSTLTPPRSETIYKASDVDQMLEIFYESTGNSSFVEKRLATPLSFWKAWYPRGSNKSDANPWIRVRLQNHNTADVRQLHPGELFPRPGAVSFVIRSAFDTQPVSGLNYIRNADQGLVIGRIALPDDIKLVYEKELLV